MTETARDLSDGDELICSRCWSTDLGKDEPYHFCRMCGAPASKRRVCFPDQYNEPIANTVTDWEQKFRDACVLLQARDEEVRRLEDKILAIEHEAGHKIFELREALEKMTELFNEISAPVWDDERMKYVNVQIDKRTYLEMKEAAQSEGNRSGMK